MIRTYLWLRGTGRLILGLAMLGFMLFAEKTMPTSMGVVLMGDVTTTNYLADAKVIYGAIQEQVSTLASLFNLFGDGSKFGKPINDIGIRGYTFLARLKPNWNMGYRKEGTTGVGAAGNVGLAQSTVGLKYAYVPITITGQAENLTKGESKAFMQAKALEAKFDMKDIVAHVNTVIAGAERGGQLATTAAGGAGTFTADNAGNLPGALYLRVGMPIDVYPVGGGALTVNNQVINTINYATRAVAFAGGAVPGNGNAVCLAGESAAVVGDFPMTAEGLISLIAATGAIQGLDPSVAGQETWASFVKDYGAVDLDPSIIMELVQYVQNRGGEKVDLLLFPSAQINRLVKISTATLRFDVNSASESSVGKKALDLGFNTFSFGGRTIVEDMDMRPDRVFAGATDMIKKFEAIPLSMADDEAGSWTRVSGANGIADAVAGLLRWYHQIGILQRSAWGCGKNLTIPGSFATLPPRL